VIGIERTNEVPVVAAFIRSLAMLAEAITVDGQEAPPGEQSSKALVPPADAFVRSLALPATAGQCQ
jgi:hypothetical protein